ncbi:hypothetical protein BH11MYX3_BH11MYX3_02380 [soil metagenome]
MTAGAPTRDLSRLAGNASTRQAWADVVVVSSGWGDGFHGRCWGLSKKGESLCLVTDFGVFPEPRAPAVV